MMKKTVVLGGFGRTTRSIYAFFPDHKAFFNAESIRISDPLAPFSPQELAETAMLILSPGIDPHHPVLEPLYAAHIPIMSDLELFARYLSTQKQPPCVVGITGSNGKSTVTTLVGKLLSSLGYRVAVGGNLGPPIFELIAEDPEIYVLELSSFQLETNTTPVVDVAAILNISPDHLDRHHTMQAYRAIKQKIYHGARHAIWNAQDSATQPEALAFSGQALSFGSKDSSIVEQNQQAALGIAETTLGLLGRRLSAQERADWQECLRLFKGLPHRLVFYGPYQGVFWVNDSKATNVGAALASIRSVAHFLGQQPHHTPASADPRIVLIAGGDAKGVDLSPLASVAHAVRICLVFGKDAALFEPLFAQTIVLSDLKEAVQSAHRLAHEGEAVLLAPACSSLDMFKDYQQRGDLFVEYLQSMYEDKDRDEE